MRYVKTLANSTHRTNSVTNIDIDNIQSIMILVKNMDSTADEESGEASPSVGWDPLSPLQSDVSLRGAHAFLFTSDPPPSSPTILFLFFSPFVPSALVFFYLSFTIYTIMH